MFWQGARVGLSPKPLKCNFASHSKELRGHIVFKHGCAPKPRKTEAVPSFPDQLVYQTFKCFLDLLDITMNNYREQTPHFATSFFNLRKLFKNQSIFHWGDQEKNYLIP